MALFVNREYHDKHSCNKCKGVTEIEVKSTSEWNIEEAKTICTVCGFTDYWAYGFFESSSYMISNCEKYYIGGDING